MLYNTSSGCYPSDFSKQRHGEDLLFQRCSLDAVCYNCAVTACKQGRLQGWLTDLHFVICKAESGPQRLSADAAPSLNPLKARNSVAVLASRMLIRTRQTILPSLQSPLGPPCTRQLGWKPRISLWLCFALQASNGSWRLPAAQLAGQCMLQPARHCGVLVCSLGIGGLEGSQIIRLLGACSTYL